MRTGKVLLVMVAVLAMAGAAGAQNLVVNGGFEEPVVNNASPYWNIYDSGTTGLGWTVEWYNVTGTPPDPAHLELHRNGAIAGVIAQSDAQYAELDTDWDGPGKPLNGEPASVYIYQNIPTCYGADYVLTFHYTQRPGEESSLGVYVNDSQVFSDSPTGGFNWIEQTVSFTATGATTKIGFKEEGPADSYGVFLDAVEVVEVEGSCPVLCAAQNVPVGHVAASDNGSILTVYYSAAEGYELNEIHVDVGCEVDGNILGIPVNKQDQPKIGNFAYSVEYDEPVTMDSFDFNLCDIEAEGCSLDDLIIAAHAVVADVGYCEANAFAYGINRAVQGDPNPGKKLYGLDLAVPAAAELFPTATGTTDGNQPNGLAFDVANGRLYYSSASKDDAPSTLWFWDGLAEVNAGNLTGFVAGAAFYDGAYYYIENRTDDVRVVTLDAVTGNVVSDSLLFGGFTGDPNLNFRFGDIAIDADGILYGNAQKLSGPGTDTDTVLGVEFFTIDLADGTYTARGSFLNSGGTRQLAFGSNGVLYGHNAGGGMFYVIDPTNGAETQIGAVGLEFTDLASGELCIPPTETAWGGACMYDGTMPGEGFPFVDRGSWATYLEYTVFDAPTCVE